MAPPDGWWPVAALSDGLLFQGDGTLELWDPATERFVDTLPGPFPVATWNNRLVSCDQCDEIHLIDIDEHTDRIVTTPPGIKTISGYGGAFSPDGRSAAVPGYDTAGHITDETAVSVVLIDFVTGSARVIPDSRRDEWTNPQLAWADEWLFYADNGDFWAYQVRGESIYRRLGVEIGGPYYGMAAL